MNTSMKFNEFDIPFGDELPVVANKKEHDGWDGELLSSKRKKHLSVVPTAVLQHKFTPFSLSHVLSMPPQKYIIDGILPEKALSVFYGPPACGKTFLSLDLAMNLATNSGNWFGRYATKSKILYVAGEGLGGLSNRLRAWLSANNINIEDVQIEIIAIPPNLFSGEADEFIKVNSNSNYDLVIIDTLARASVGADENSARDMGKVVEACDRIIKKMDCAVLLIHHAGRAGWERGSTALRGAADAMFEVKKHDDGTRELVLNGQSAKFKDAAETESIFFKPVQEGESCVIESTSSIKQTPKRPIPKGEDQRLVYSLIGQLLEGRSTSVVGKPTTTFDLLLNLWRNVVTDSRKKEPGGLRRVVNAMLKNGVLEGNEAALSLS